MGELIAKVAGSGEGQEVSTTKGSARKGKNDGRTWTTYAKDKAVAVRDSSWTHRALAIGFVLGFAAMAAGGLGYAAANGYNVGPFSFLKAMGTYGSIGAAGGGAAMAALGSYGVYRIASQYFAKGPEGDSDGDGEG